MTTTYPELLSGLTPTDAAAVMALGTRTHLDAGETLFQLGGEAHALFAIERGRIALSLPMRVRDREEDVLIEERTSGQTVGWSAFIPPHRFTLSARATTDTDLLVLPSDVLLAHFAARPDVGYAVSRSIAAVVGQRLQVVQAMWLREMQRVVRLTHA